MATTTKRQKHYRETPEFGLMVRRMVGAYGRRVANGDIENLTELVRLRAELDASIDAAAIALHDGNEDNPNGYSWTEIGAVLGISRQAARQRFGGAGA